MRSSILSSSANRRRSALTAPADSARLALIAVALTAVVLTGLALAPAAADAQESAVTDTLASIGGTVVDSRGAPVSGADAYIVGTSITARTNEAGKFLLDGITPGRAELRVRKLGYQTASARLELQRGMLTEVTVRFATEATELEGVNVVATLFNQLTGTVVDELALPIPGAVVDIVGTSRSVTTRADGRFVFFDVAPGAYLVQVRTPSFLPNRFSVQMVAQIERDLTLKLTRGDYSVKSMERDAIAVREARTRQQSARPQAAMVSRAELARLGNMPLIDALFQTSGANAWSLIPNRQACVIMDGDEPVLPNSTGYGFSPQATRGYGATSIGGGANTGVRGLEGGMLQFFQADQVELVEIYPPRADESRTLCSRFPVESGCGCPEVGPSPPVVVLWRR